jgi:hypothetical protein
MADSNGYGRSGEAVDWSDLTVTYRKTGPPVYRDATGRLLSQDQVSAEIAAFAREIPDIEHANAQVGTAMSSMVRQVKLQAEHDIQWRLLWLLVHRLGGSARITDDELAGLPHRPPMVVERDGEDGIRLTAEPWIAPAGMAHDDEWARRQFGLGPETPITKGEATAERVFAPDLVAAVAGAIRQQMTGDEEAMLRATPEELATAALTAAVGTLVADPGGHQKQVIWALLHRLGGDVRLGYSEVTSIPRSPEIDVFQDSDGVTLVAHGG